MAFCSECKCCEAQASMADDPNPLCVFCEDGVPCPNRQRAARAVVAPAPSTPLISPKKERAHPRTHRSLRAKAHDPVSPFERQYFGDADPAPAGEAGDSIQVPIAGDDRQEEKERTTMPPKDDEEIPRYCGREGCTKKLTRANKSGFCTQHFYDSKKKSANGSAPKKPRIAKPAPPAIPLPS